jgi:hypothetical protein
MLCSFHSPVAGQCTHHPTRNVEGTQFQLVSVGYGAGWIPMSADATSVNSPPLTFFVPYFVFVYGSVVMLDILHQHLSSSTQPVVSAVGWWIVEP